MELTFRAATPAERLYSYRQCVQIANLCGSPGNMRVELDNIGEEFHGYWETCTSAQIVAKVEAEFDTVLDMLRFDEQYGQVLKNCTTMINYCHAHPESRIGETHTYVFRADTNGSSYLLRCTPTKLFDNAYICPYRRDCLERHMKQAEKGIRFITPDGKERFKVPDGEHIRIITGGGGIRERTVRFIDETHFELVHEWGSTVYHIREFAERLDQTGGKVIPLRSVLPDRCFCVLPDSSEIIIVKKGENDYYQWGMCGHDQAKAQSIVNGFNEIYKITKAQAAAMLAGAMLGWDVPAADPRNYDEQGHPIKPKHHDRSDAR